MHGARSISSVAACKELKNHEYSVSYQFDMIPSLYTGMLLLGMSLQSRSLDLGSCNRQVAIQLNYSNTSS